jgi:hypothetical protein
MKSCHCTLAAIIGPEACNGCFNDPENQNEVILGTFSPDNFLNASSYTREEKPDEVLSEFEKLLEDF